MWTQFMDMHSGGSRKEKFSYCYIEAPIEEAKKIFYNRFGHNPECVTCSCCGDDYSITESEDLAQATAYHRNCAFVYFKDGKEIPESEGWKSGKGLLDGATSKYVERANTRWGNRELISLEDYLASDDVMVIYDKDIKPEERQGEIPAQGYVWVD